MDSIPSPLNRLLQLERDVQQIMSHQSLSEITGVSDVQKIARHVWPADELLLIRLLRRSPQALIAYQANAELTISSERGVRLSQMESQSSFQFCELACGDAVAWTPSSVPSWILQSEAFISIFNIPPIDTDGQILTLQRLPLFKPVVRGREWTLFRPGVMGLAHRNIPEEEHEMMILRRLENLERQMTQQTTKMKTEIKELQSKIRVYEDLLNRALRILETKESIA